MENLVSPSFIWTCEKVESISRWLYPEMDSVLSLICVYGLLEKAIKNCHNGLYRIMEIYRRTHPSILPSEPPSSPLTNLLFAYHCVHLSSTSFFPFLYLPNQTCVLFRGIKKGSYGTWTPMCKYGLCRGKLVKSPISLFIFTH